MKDEDSYMIAEVNRSVDVLRRGGVILYPTDTVWGIGCDPRDSSAVRRIFEIKQRAESKALILLAGSRAQIENVTGSPIAESIEQLILHSTRPLTVIYPHARGIAPELMASDGSIAIRLSGEPFSCAMCLGFGFPVVSTSANISGAPTPLSFADISVDIKEMVDYIADWNRIADTCGNKPSKIIKTAPDGTVTVIRE